MGCGYFAERAVPTKLVKQAAHLLFLPRPAATHRALQSPQLWAAESAMDKGTTATLLEHQGLGQHIDYYPDWQ